MSSKPTCFGKDVIVRGVHGYQCYRHPRCLLMDECYGALLTRLYLGYIEEIAECEVSLDVTDERELSDNSDGKYDFTEWDGKIGKYR